MDLATLDHGESHRESADEACTGNTAASLVVSHSEPSYAKVEERGARGLKVQASLLDLAQVGEQAGEDLASLADERVQTREELLVGEIGEIHRSLLPSRISSSGLPHQGAIGRGRASTQRPRQNDAYDAYGSPRGTMTTHHADVSARPARSTSTEIGIEREEKCSATA